MFPPYCGAMWFLLLTMIFCFSSGHRNKNVLFRSSVLLAIDPNILFSLMCTFHFDFVTEHDNDHKKGSSAVFVGPVRGTSADPFPHSLTDNERL